MKTVLITGATQGLGLAIARALEADEDVQVVLAVRDLARGEAVARTLRGKPRVVALDLSSLEAIARFTESWREPLWALVNNAGVQVTGELTKTPDGFEETLAVNWLAPLRLTLGLLPWLKGGRVLNIGSGTHNPENRMATVFGFRGGRFSSIAELARGESDGATPKQRGMDRYATSKLIVTAGTAELARRYPATTFLTLDPGLMAGTGLARTAPAIQKLAWSTVLRWATPLLPDASTPTRSAGAARWLLTEGQLENGGVYAFDRRLSTRVWSGARVPELQRAVVDQALTLLAPWAPRSGLVS